jgi:hypothetical protein
MDPLTSWTMILLALCAAAALFAAGRQSAPQTSRSEPPPGSDLESATIAALLLVAEDRALRAEQHADDAQVLLNSILGHPAVRDRQLTVIPGGAQ